MSFNIEVEGGSSVRLPTAGKYCDMDIIIKALGGGGSANIEVVTIASSFATADAAYGVLSAMVTSGETTYFVRKSKSWFDAVCLSAYFNLPENNQAGYARHRTFNGVTGASSWTSAYDLKANAGDEYYKVVIS